MASPLELLENRPDRVKPYLNSLAYPGVAALLGVGFGLFHNFAYRKPLWSGIQKHIIFALTGGGLGYYFDKKRDEHMADRDAVLRHYIQLHPEDFPTPDRKKYGDVLERWTPIR